MLKSQVKELTHKVVFSKRGLSALKKGTKGLGFHLGSRGEGGIVCSDLYYIRGVIEGVKHDTTVLCWKIKPSFIEFDTLVSSPHFVKDDAGGLVDFYMKPSELATNLLDHELSERKQLYMGYLKENQLKKDTVKSIEDQIKELEAKIIDKSKGKVKGLEIFFHKGIAPGDLNPEISMKFEDFMEIFKYVLP